MKRWKKFLLVLMSLLYLLGILLVTLPKLSLWIVGTIYWINHDWMLSPNLLVSYYLFILLIITTIFFLIFLFYPVEKKEFILEKNQGQLILTNQGLETFIQRKLTNEGLKNVKVNIKNTTFSQKFRIIAETVYQKEKIQELSEIKASLESELEKILNRDGTGKFKIKTYLRLKPLNSEKKSARVQ